MAHRHILAQKEERYSAGCAPEALLEQSLSTQSSPMWNYCHGKALLGEVYKDEVKSSKYICQVLQMSLIGLGLLDISGGRCI